jgi:hypothetical protein
MNSVPAIFRRSCCDSEDSRGLDRGCEVQARRPLNSRLCSQPATSGMIYRRTSSRYPTSTASANLRQSRIALLVWPAHPTSKVVHAHSGLSIAVRLAGGRAHCASNVLSKGEPCTGAMRLNTNKVSNRMSARRPCRPPASSIAICSARSTAARACFSLAASVPPPNTVTARRDPPSSQAAIFSRSERHWPRLARLFMRAR